MESLNKIVFINLFKEACKKCFGFSLASPLSETDSRLLSTEIFEHTGLVIGAKSIKNYSFYVLNIKEGKTENPSVATLDTLARYVLDAPWTDELMRKKNEYHYPYWFQYRSRFLNTISHKRIFPANAKKIILIFSIVLVLAIVLFAIASLTRHKENASFTDNFTSVSENSLINRGWIIKSVDTTWWNRRNEKPGHLSLYTLKGDNWRNTENPACIKNLLMRRIYADCFITEIHLTDFVPKENWQQAGILLSEDSTFRGKALRISISYNDYFGGYEKPPEIIIQVVSSVRSGNLSKPEEIAHIPLFLVEPGTKSLVEANLAKSALKIEKKGNHLRFLYTAGSAESFAFKEAVSGDYNIKVKYISLFTMQGWSDNEDHIPAYFDSFNFANISCEK